MELGRENVEESGSRGIGSALKKRLSPLCYSLMFATFLLDTHVHHSKLSILWAFFLVTSVLSVFFPGWFTHLVFWTVGTIEYIEISDPQFEQRIRRRHEWEINQLDGLGFKQLFYEGETTSIYRLFLVFPAIIKFMLWFRGGVFHKAGTRIINGFPTFASGDSIAYAQVGSWGVKFRSSFKDGTILESKNYGDEDMPTGPSIIRHSFKRETISDTWAEHQRWIRLLETKDNPVVRHLSFNAWVAIVRKVSADLRQHL